MSRKRSFVRWVARLAVAAVVLLGVAMFAVPHLLDAPAVQARLEQWASRAVRGDVAWEHLEVRLFPAPHGMLRGARIQIPDTLTATVERVELGLRLWPLLRGRVEIDSITVLRPALHFQLPAARKSAAAPDPLAAYRAVLRPAVDAAQRLLPDGVVVLEGARVELAGPGLPRIGALGIDARVTINAEDVTAGGTVTGEHWDRVQFEARVASLDLRANATVDAAGVKLQGALDALLRGTDPTLVLPRANARVEARTDGRSALEAVFKAELPSIGVRRRDRRLDVAEVRLAGTATLSGDDIELALSDFRLGDLVPSGRATLRLAVAQRAPEASLRIDVLDVARLRAAALAISGDHAVVRDYVARVGGGRITELRVAAKSGALKTLFRLPNLSGSLRLSGGEMRLPVIDKPASGIGARVELAGSTLKVRDVTARVGNSALRQGDADIELAAPRRLEASGGQAVLAVDELVAWLRTREQVAEVMQAVQGVSGAADLTLHKLLLPFDRPRALTYDLTVQPKQMRAKVADLPEATIDGGTLRATPDALTLDRVGAAALDATARVSGTVRDYRTRRPSVDARVDEGAAGREAIAWIWQRAGLPQRGRPATPLRLAAQQVQWSTAGLDANLRVRFPGGLEAGVDLGLHGEVLEIRRLALKDGESDAVLRFARRGPLLDAGFAGVLTGPSLASMLAEAPDEISGGVSGDLQVTYDTERQGRSSAKGSLAAERIDLGSLLPVPIRLERADLTVDGRVLRMREVTLDWAGQRATVRGEIAQPASGLVVRAEVESPGIDLDKLMPAQTEPQGKPSAAAKLWPLPVTGTLAVRAGYVLRHGLRVEPLRASLALEPRRAQLQVGEAALCGIAFPFSATATPERVEAAVRLSAKDEELERVAHCLTNKGILITGRFDLAADLTARGEPGEFARALEGPVRLHLRDGEIRKFALVGNILSLTNVAGVLEQEVKLDRDGFRYRDITAEGRFGRGAFNVEQAFLDSDAVGLAATGRIGLDYQARLNVLVAPFSRVDRVVRGIPILGYVIGGAFTSVPVGVSGDIRDPLVVPLGPGAVTSELLGIFERTLKLPGKLVAPLGAEPPAK